MSSVKSIEGKWNELKSKFRRIFSNFTDEDVNQVNGDWEKLSARLQKTYGYSEARAQAEIEKFRNSHH